MSDGKTSWPELVGKSGTEAVQIIKNETGFTHVSTVPQNSFVTMDYRTDRVRVYVDEQGKVRSAPHVG